MKRTKTETPNLVTYEVAELIFVVFPKYYEYHNFKYPTSLLSFCEVMKKDIGWLIESIEIDLAKNRIKNVYKSNTAYLLEELRKGTPTSQIDYKKARPEQVLKLLFYP